MHRVLSHFCAYVGKIGPREPPDDGEMDEMTLPPDTEFEIRALAVWGRAR